MRVGGRVSGLLEKVVRSLRIILRDYVMHILTLAPCFHSHLPENRQFLRHRRETVDRLPKSGCHGLVCIMSMKEITCNELNS